MTTTAEHALEQGADILPGLQDTLRAPWQRMLLELGRLLHWSIDPSGARSSSGTLLPPNATAAEHRLEQATARLGELPTPLRDLWNADACPAHLLPWLAWALQVDIWDNSWSEDDQRAVIRGAITVHRRKGTPWAIRRAVKNAGYGDATLSEGDSSTSYDGAVPHDGRESYIGGLDWARYRLIMSRPITNAQADQVRRLLAGVAPVRCHLVELVFTQIANLYDGASTYGGAYNHGVA